jgi:hypothetical protein
MSGKGTTSGYKPCKCHPETCCCRREDHYPNKYKVVDLDKFDITPKKKKKHEKRN